MKFISASQLAKKWNISDRTVRNYCANGEIPGAYLSGKIWYIPEHAIRPSRKNARSETKSLLKILRMEKADKIKGGIYHKLQIELTFNTNHMEGSKLTHDQTRCIFETNTIGEISSTINIDDIIETANHFNCINVIIEHANRPLTESFIKQLHKTLKNGTSDSRRDWLAVGAYKKFPNEVGGQITTSPEEVPKEVQHLLKRYNNHATASFEDMIAFHYDFEAIHPFQDGNGRIGRLLLLKECLKNNIVPFIIDEELKYFYYRGMKEWYSNRGFLIETCRVAQDKFKQYLDYFRITY